MFQLVARTGAMNSWPVAPYHLITPDMISLGRTIGKGNWGHIRHGIVSIGGKKVEVAVKQPHGNLGLLSINTHTLLF